MQILVCLFLFAVGDEAQEPFELADFLNSTFPNRAFNGIWMTDDTFYYRDTTTNDIYRFNAESWSRELFFPASVLTNYTGASYTISPNNNYILIRYDPVSVFRHSSVARYTVYQIENGEYYPIANDEHLQYVQWAPSGNGIVYVFENNIYYVPTPSSAEIKITTDGVADIVYNGVPDWVYEEEVLSSGSAMWFSPDGDRLAFAHFNDTNVPEFNYFIYDTEPIQYPQVVKLRYPKVNAINPDFELRVVTLSDPNNIKSLPIIADGQESRDYVLFGVTWATNDEVVAVVENRIQNEAVVKRCAVESSTCEIENSFSEPNGWIELSPPVYSADGTECLMLRSQPEDDDSYMHLVLYNTINKEFTRLTHGKRVVLSIGGWDKVRNIVYYTGSTENAPSTQHVYYYDIANVNDTCITCSYQTPEGFCRFASASFSKNYSYFAETCHGPGPNYISINSIEDLQGAQVYEDNQVTREHLQYKLLPQVEDFEVNVEGGFTARARLLLPPNLDTSGATKYPVIVNVYGGPDSNQITDRYSTGFQSYIVTNRQYIYAYIDGRGSGKKGDNMRFQIYKKMGTVEIEDQIAVMKALRDTLPYIDADRIGIWGWSYGGFATAWVLVQDIENVFKFGLSVAPVTDFALYDTIYTERYMRLLTAEDNQEGYNNTDITRRVEALRNKSFFLIHGNADDNVHYQQSMLLAKALEHADIMFYQMSYPDENHSLSSVYPHLYHSIDRFFARCFGLPDPVYRHIVSNDLDQL